MNIFTVLSWAIFILAGVLYFVTPQKELAGFVMLTSVAFNTLPKS